MIELLGSLWQLTVADGGCCAPVYEELEEELEDELDDEEELEDDEGGVISCGEVFMNGLATAESEDRADM